MDLEGMMGGMGWTVGTEDPVLPERRGTRAISVLLDPLDPPDPLDPADPKVTLGHKVRLKAGRFRNCT